MTWSVTSRAHRIRRAALVAGLDPEGLASHSGRRTVVTALYADGGLDLADVARHVGHSDPSTTAEYVRSLGHRPSTRRDDDERGGLEIVVFADANPVR